MSVVCDSCKYYVRISNAVWEGMYLAEKLPSTALRDEKLNFCAMAGRFLRSAVFACTIKEGKEAHIDLSVFEKKGVEWTPSNTIVS
jgi:hypothetical protein